MPTPKVKALIKTKGVRGTPSIIKVFVLLLFPFSGINCERKFPTIILATAKVPQKNLFLF